MLGNVHEPSLLALLDHLQHVRDDLAGALDQHLVAHGDAQPFDFIHVVQRGRLTVTPPMQRARAPRTASARRCVRR